MREIKFRAWHIEQEKMFCVESLHLADEYCVLNDGDIYSDAFSVKKSDIELMQFIGIQDKSGREIYEGDIFGAEISIGKGRCTSHHVVSWHDSGFMGKQIGTYGAYIGIAYYTQNIGNPYVVIGNVHQNPELLEQNDE